MQSTVFYSWQSDSDSRVNRSFIEAALKAAVAKLNRDVVVKEALRESPLSVDKDIKGLPGMPPIADSIFAKIDKCLAFVPDMTFVGTGHGDRRISNPNVLIEYGWALCSRSHARIVAVMNTAYGEPTGENLPFDMRHMRRPITYTLSPEDDESRRREVKAELIGNLYDALALVAKLPGGQETVDASDGGALTVGSPSLFFPLSEPLTTGYADSGTTRELRMHESARMYLRVIPTRDSREPLTSRGAQQLMQGGRLLPLGRDGGISFERNAFGAFVFARDGNRILKLTQLFKSRELWGIDAELLERVADSRVQRSNTRLRPLCCIRAQLCEGPAQLHGIRKRYAKYRASSADHLWRNGNQQLSNDGSHKYAFWSRRQVRRQICRGRGCTQHAN